MKDSQFNYYDISDNWTDYKSNLDANQCQESCRYSLSCLFSIHFYENQNLTKVLFEDDSELEN